MIRAGACKSIHKQTENEKGKRKGKGMAKPKAVWDKHSQEIFIKLCLSEVRAGNMPTTHFNKIGWENIVQRFVKLTGKNYVKPQLKNKWDVLKKEWQLWKSLAEKENELGWDLVKQTIAASDEWWENKLKINPNVARFREKGLEHCSKLDQLFGDKTAIGTGACVPLSGVAPDSMSRCTSKKDEWSLDNDVNIDDDNVEGQTPSDIPVCDGPATPFSDHTKRKSSESRPSQCQMKKKCAASMLSEQLIRPADSMKIPATSTMVNSSGFAIKDVMDMLHKLPGVEKCDDLYMLGTRLFIKPEYREMFVALGDDETRLMWLRQEKRRENAT